jgi:hypothetical protein
MYSSSDEGLHRGDRGIESTESSGTSGNVSSNAALRSLPTYPSSVGEYAATFSRREKVASYSVSVNRPTM